MRLGPAATAAIVASAVLAGCAQPAAPLPTEQRTLTVPGGWFLELNYEVEAGATMTWSWNATAVLDFDLHTHFDGQVQEPVRATTTGHEGAYTAERSGGHSLMWTNPDAEDVVVDLTVPVGAEPVLAPA